MRLIAPACTQVGFRPTEKSFDDRVMIVLDSLDEQPEYAIASSNMNDVAPMLLSPQLIGSTSNLGSCSF